jgi:hypothetical protein
LRGSKLGKGQDAEENRKGNSRPLGGRHGEGFLSFGKWFENGLVLGELRREGRLRNLVRDDRRRSLAGGELGSGAGEKIGQQQAEDSQG